MVGVGLCDPLLSMVHGQDDLHTTKPVIKYTLPEYFVIKIALNINVYFLCVKDAHRQPGKVFLTVHTRNCLQSLKRKGFALF